MLRMTCNGWSLVASLFFLVSLCGSRTFDFKTYIVSQGDNPFYRPSKLQGFSASGKQPPHCTSDDLPCYDAILTFIRDGNCAFNLSDPNFFFEHFAKVGQGREGIIAAGKKAVDFFFRQTGFDFRNLPDEAFINAEASILDGSVIFRPGHFTSACRYRLTTLEVGGKVQFVNRLVSTIGWFIRFNQETRLFGALNTVIPANTQIAWGSYVILPCEEGRDKNCQSLYDQKNPYTPIFIEWNARSWLGTFQPGNFNELDQDLYSKKFGIGRGLGIIYPEEKGQEAVQVLRFPSTINDKGDK